MGEPVLTPEEKAEYLDWPDRRNCDWDCPWPGYCIDCHSSAYTAMIDGRRRLIEWMAWFATPDIDGGPTPDDGSGRTHR